jgi:hypothetical protein
VLSDCKISALYNVSLLNYLSAYLFRVPLPSMSRDQA